LCTYGISDELSSSARNGRLLNNDCTLTSVLSNNASNGLESGHISSAAGTNTTVLRGSVDGNKNDISLADVLGDVGREEQVRLALIDGNLALLGGGTLAVGGRLVRDLGRSATITGDSDDIVQTRLVDRRVAGVPTSDTVGVSVDDGDLDVGVLESNDSGSRATCKQSVSAVQPNSLARAVYGSRGLDKHAIMILSALSQLSRT
jgi:hypothetical protein